MKGLRPVHRHACRIRQDRRRNDLKGRRRNGAQADQNQGSLREALKEITALLDAPSGSPEADRLEVLSILVEAYEEEHHPIGPPDPIEAILYRMDQQSLTRRDLEPFIGNRARVSEVLNRKRPLSVEMIRRLHKGLGIPAEILIRPYKTGKAA